MVAQKVTHSLGDSAAAKFPKTSKAAPTNSGWSLSPMVLLIKVDLHLPSLKVVKNCYIKCSNMVLKFFFFGTKHQKCSGFLLVLYLFTIIHILLYYILHPATYYEQLKTPNSWLCRIFWHFFIYLLIASVSPVSSLHLSCINCMAKRLWTPEHHSYMYTLMIPCMMLIPLLLLRASLFWNSFPLDFKMLLRVAFRILMSSDQLCLHTACYVHGAL